MADEDDNLVLNPASFTGPERRLVQQTLKLGFSDLMAYTRQAVNRLYEAEAWATPLAPLVRADETLVFPDEVLQAMVWVQSLRTDAEAKLEDFDHLTMSDLNSARIRGLQGKATGDSSSTTSSSGSPSADSSPA